MAKNNEKLQAYFLGELSEEEGLCLENEYLENEAKFAELQGAENDLLDAYIRKELPPNKLKSFEENYLNSPFRRQRLRFAKTLYNHLQSKENLVQTPEKERFNWTGFFSFWKIGVAFASVILLLLGGFWVFNNLQNSSNQEIVLSNTSNSQPPKTEPKTISSPQPSPQISPTVERNAIKVEPKSTATPNPTLPPKITVSPTPKVEKTPTQTKLNETKSNQTVFLALSGVGLRDGGKNNEVTIKKETKNVALRLNLPQTTAKNFQITIQNVDGETIYQTKNSQLNRKSLNLNLPAKLFKTNDYIIEISTTNSNGETEKIANYNFRVKK